MYTAAAWRSLPDEHEDTVWSVPQLTVAGWSHHAIRAQLRAHRWQRCGRAIVLHNGRLTRGEQCQAAVVHLGPRAVLTSFTAAEICGLAGWHRDEVHVLVPRGARAYPLPGVRVHYVGEWARVPRLRMRPLHLLAPALIIAAGGFGSPRPACGILAAAVQQRLLGAADLRSALEAARRVRHRAALLSAVGDIEQGAHALSEIDFVRLCRRFGLPTPTQQAVRHGADGRRRYLDASWVLPDGRRIVVEVDGANHMRVQDWTADQWRQNELVIGGDIVLRYPSVLVRNEPAYVAEQLARALGVPLRRRSSCT